MRRFVLHLTVAGLTFLVGSVISASYQSLLTAIDTFESFPVESYELTFVTVDSRPELTISSVMDACGPTANYHSYVASDGAHLFSSCRQLASARQADRELKKSLATAIEIIERHQELHEHTPTVLWERVVMRTSGGTVVAIRVSGKSFCETTAPTLKHLQLLEKR